jgi:hypothetical protein
VSAAIFVIAHTRRYLGTAAAIPFTQATHALCEGATAICSWNG